MAGKTNSNQNGTNSEPVYFVGSEFEDGSKVIWKSLARTEQEFRDTETNELMNAPLFIMKVNDGVQDGYIKIWGNAEFAKSSVAFKQIQSYVDANEISVFPVLNINKELTFKTGGKGTRKYYYFEELVKKLDLDKLGI